MIIPWLQNANPVSLFIAAWGAGLSTFLAIREISKSRLKIDVGYNFTSHPDIGNEIIIRNISRSPIIVTYWQLLWRKKRFFNWIAVDSIEPDEFHSDFQIKEYSSHILSFKELNYFNTSKKFLNGTKLYLSLYIAGKSKPLLIKVYG